MSEKLNKLLEEKRAQYGAFNVDLSIKAVRATYSNILRSITPKSEKPFNFDKFLGLEYKSYIDLYKEYKYKYKDVSTDLIVRSLCFGLVISTGMCGVYVTDTDLHSLMSSIDDFEYDNIREDENYFMLITRVSKLIITGVICGDEICNEEGIELIAKDYIANALSRVSRVSDDNTKEVLKPIVTDEMGLMFNNVIKMVTYNDNYIIKENVKKLFANIHSYENMDKSKIDMKVLADLAITRGIFAYAHEHDIDPSLTLEELLNTVFSNENCDGCINKLRDVVDKKYEINKMISVVEAYDRFINNTTDDKDYRLLLGYVLREVADTFGDLLDNMIEDKEKAKKEKEKKETPISSKKQVEYITVTVRQ